MNTGALIRLWNLTQEHPGTSGAEVAVKVLLALYNGPRFKFDVTELRRLDSANLKDALGVIASDAARTEREVHEWLNLLSGRMDFGWRLEYLAFEYKIKGRCKKSDLPALTPAVICFETGKAGCSLMEKTTAVQSYLHHQAG